jgi:GNAT superfamily N-acetyltransferase
MARSRDDLRIRLARLDDAAAVVDVHKSHVSRLYRQIEDEQHDVGYDDLTLDERFGFGGQWMSVETCAVHLNHLLLRHSLPVVVELDGRIVAEMELFLGREGPRYGMNCHIGLLFVHSDFLGRGIGNKLVDYAVKMAEERNCDSLTVASDEYHENFYRRCGFTFGPMMASVEVHPARCPLEIVKLPPQVSAQSFTWGMDMPIGRVQSSALHLSDLAEAFAIPSYADVVKRTDFLEIGGSPALVAHVRHSSGNTMVAAWARDVSTGDLVDATLTVMSDAGVQTANIFLYKDDYEALAGRVDTRLLGYRRTLVCHL